MIPGLLELGIVSLIFGGCCSNVFALEAIVKQEPDSGLLITFFQFLLTMLFALPSQLDPTRPPFFIQKSAVPFRKWAASASMFFAVNMLNNWAFAFQISVPVHIILRSFGSVTTMAAGWLRGKTYSRVQVASVVVLTVGVVVSAWADAVAKGKSMSTSSIDLTSASFEAGLLILLVAQLLSAYMGQYVQDIYAAHGRCWQQNLFYSHFLSVPLFAPLAGTLRGQYARLARSTPLLDYVAPPQVELVEPDAFSAGEGSAALALARRLLARTPTSLALLLANAATQLLCISGVNVLSAHSSAVTVTIVLNVRKLVSFLFSVWLFGNEMGGQMVVGAVLVFGAGALYGWETSVGIRRRRAEEEKGGRERGKKGE
ncbi:UAA transporter [Lineolata rhizophorae]|uniref:UAA transporter n=1 Tax=Lineolata rhizophorae TaxID=578093 RepID=A0A6A6P6V4_9PEZI|nr:UAA transporter [Lineolata rhizophorae]